MDLDVYYVDNNGTSRKPMAGYMKTADEDKPRSRPSLWDGEDFAIEESG